MAYQPDSWIPVSTVDPDFEDDDWTFTTTSSFQGTAISTTIPYEGEAHSGDQVLAISNLASAQAVGNDFLNSSQGFVPNRNYRVEGSVKGYVLPDISAGEAEIWFHFENSAGTTITETLAWSIADLQTESWTAITATEPITVTTPGWASKLKVIIKTDTVNGWIAFDNLTVSKNVSGTWTPLTWEEGDFEDSGEWTLSTDADFPASSVWFGDNGPVAAESGRYTLVMSNKGYSQSTSPLFSTGSEELNLLTETVQVKLQLVNAFVVGGLEFDDVSAYYGGAGAPTALSVPDPGFETGGVWTDWNNITGASGRTSQTDPHGGSYVMALGNNHLAHGYAASQSVTITGGEIYRFRIYAKQNIAANGKGISFRLAFYKSGGLLSQRITSAKWSKPVETVWSADDGWLQYEGVAIAPSDAVSVKLEVSANYLDGYAFFDDVTFDEFDPGDTIYRSTYGLAGQPIAIQVTTVPTGTNDGLYFVHTDHLGSVSATSDGVGQLAGNIIRFDPFGDYRPGSGPGDITDRGFTGHKHNDYIKLIYMGARYYLGAVGRFISADSIVPYPINPQSFNRYSYVNNRPLNRTDPTGHRDCEFDDQCGPLPPRSAPTSAGTFGLIDNLSVWTLKAITEPRVTPPPAAGEGSISGWLVNQITGAINSEVYDVIFWNLRSTPARYTGATMAWIRLVRTGGIWDFKGDLRRAGTLFDIGTENHEINLVNLGGYYLNYQVVANIFFGFVGKSLGFTEEYLHLGAAIVQLPGRIGDDPIYTWAINFGFYLYELYGDDIDSLTEEAFNNALQDYIYENPPPIPENP